MTTSQDIKSNIQSIFYKHLSILIRLEIDHSLLGNNNKTR